MGALILSKQINLNVDWCKGCGICVEYCPKNVLSLEKNMIQLEKADDCIFCGLCELRCPDYAIYISTKESESQGGI